MKKTKIKINVTQRDIDNAEGRSGSRCPIYKSIQRHPELKDKYTVGIQGLYFGRDFYPSIKFPDKAKQFSLNHWIQKEVKPFSFTIELKKT